MHAHTLTRDWVRAGTIALASSRARSRPHALLVLLEHAPPPAIGRILGGADIVLAVVEYGTKVYWFPEHGSSYQFPFTAAWLLVVLYRMATSLPWVDERIAAATLSPGQRPVAHGAPPPPPRMP